MAKDAKFGLWLNHTKTPSQRAARSRASGPRNPSFYSLKIHLHTGFPGSIYVGSSSGNWVEGQKSLTPNPKLKALTRNKFRVGTEAAKRGRL